MTRIKLLSYNIQVAIPGESLRKSIIGGWRHILPHASRLKNLADIAHLVRNFDIVALQEVDAGSLRSNYINQIEYLAKTAHFPFWHYQLNRNLGHLARQCNGVLSRYHPVRISNHKLPGVIPGRGAITLQFGKSRDQLILVIVHLALSRRARQQQLAYVAELVRSYEHVIIMGDMNSSGHYLTTDSPLRDIGLRSVNQIHNTFPSWRPRRNIDHILVSSSLIVSNVEVLGHPYSDHLPLAIEVTLPSSIVLV